MGKSATTWKQGQSGNPAGRKPKGRALAEILQKAGGKTHKVDGKNMAARQVVAQMLWQLAATGQAQFPDGSSVVMGRVALDDWLAVVKFIYQHIDGPARTEVDLTSGGAPLNKRPDYSRLSVEELKLLRALTAKMSGEDAEPDGDDDAA